VFSNNILARLAAAGGGGRRQASFSPREKVAVGRMRVVGFLRINPGPRLLPRAAPSEIQRPPPGPSGPTPQAGFPPPPGGEGNGSRLFRRRNRRLSRTTLSKFPR